jgi:hypothetical protein
MELDLQGRIEQFTLPEILQLIASGRKSGTLGIQRDDSIVMIYFQDGKIIYGYGPRQTYHLGQLLKERGILSESDLQEAIQVQAKTENSRRLGEILTSRHFIDRTDLNAVVKDQIEQLLYSLLSWRTGSFKFYENQFPTDEEILVDISVENVILEGLRRLDEKNFIEETLPDLDSVYCLSAAQAERPRDISLSGPEWNIMALVDGYRSVNNICSLSAYGRDDTLKKLAQLKLAGIITKTEKKPEESSSELARMTERLATLFEDYLTEKRSGSTAGRDITRTYGESDD